jgi:hypothetical protein
MWYQEVTFDEKGEKILSEERLAVLPPKGAIASIEFVEEEPKEE